MMLVALLGLLVQQPAMSQTRRPAAPPAAQQTTRLGQNEVPPRPEPRTPYDSTVEAIIDLGTKVAEVKSGLELFRRAAFNEPTGTVLERSEVFGRSCRNMVSAVRRAEGLLCRSCLPRTAQEAVNAYRNNLPNLSRLGTQCASRLEQLRRGVSADTAAARLRREARPMSARLTDGLRPYETRLLAVRREFGWEQPVMPSPQPR